MNIIYNTVPEEESDEEKNGDEDDELYSSFH